MTTLPFELFLYVLFLAYAAISLHKKRMLGMQLPAAATMFAISTTDVGYTLHLLFQKLLDRGLTYEELRPKYIFLLADLVLVSAAQKLKKSIMAKLSTQLHKFYLMWSSKRWVLIGPAILLITATGCGFAFEGTTLTLAQYSWINVSLTVVLNVIITGFTVAGRILYVGAFARPMLATGVPRALSIFAAVIIESGTLYAVYVSLDLAFKSNPTAHIILDGGLIQIVSIMPTMILVQMAVGRASAIGTPAYPLQEVTGSSYWSEENRGNYPLESIPEMP
ncbi:hypothetical protein H0H93_010023 [Arthromyces matolae]|nr:hypothetical protein H0H93_010023 [Arthromyces matolae]